MWTCSNNIHIHTCSRHTYTSKNILKLKRKNILITFKNKASVLQTPTENDFLLTQSSLCTPHNVIWDKRPKYRNNCKSVSHIYSMFPVSKFSLSIFKSKQATFKMDITLF